MSAVTRLVVAGAMSFLIAACTSSTQPTPIPRIVTPQPTPTTGNPAPVPGLVVFNEPATGFATSDLYDAHDRIIQLTNTGDLVWTPDGTRLRGYFVASWSSYYPPPAYFISGKICDIPCDFSVRFGSSDGKRRAYLTVDYGHENPGTLVDVEVVNGTLVVTQTSSYAPGTPTLSGVVTASTPTGPVPVAGADVYRGVPAGWQGVLTDENGFYEIRGLIEGTDKVFVSKPGYQTESREIALYGDVGLNVELVRR